ncbi:MAG: NADH-quinone oxidoreductase subunit C [Syntrophobacteraceae bacterium]
MEIEKALTALSRQCPDLGLKRADRHGMAEITVSLESLPQVMKTLRALGFDMLSDVVGIDRMPRPVRFDVIYLLMAMEDFSRLAVKVEVAQDQEVPSVSGIWNSANWGEREVFDLLGIGFSGHPDLRRILMWENFEGHPLRKDFPLEGKDFDKPFDTETIRDYF